MMYEISNSQLSIKACLSGYEMVFQSFASVVGDLSFRLTLLRVPDLITATPGDALDPLKDPRMQEVPGCREIWLIWTDKIGSRT
jgi:hypothetical protein